VPDQEYGETGAGRDSLTSVSVVNFEYEKSRISFDISYTIQHPGGEVQMRPKHSSTIMSDEAAPDR
jgi:hypothetical protein